MVKVKICGITNLKDARQAVDEGADFLGFNFYPRSPRYVTPRRARGILRRLPRKIASVGVFVNEQEDKMLEIARQVGLGHLQLHGEESPATIAHLARNLPVIKAVRVRHSFRVAELAHYEHASAFLLDGFDRRRHGGSGKTFRWNIALRAKRAGHIFIAGGLTPENVSEAIRSAKPYAVDVCSGVESKPGKKDPALVVKFMRAVRSSRRAA
ncbi:MAG TPA: phosphoribosylanthranilate isomerase [Candidatus Acidoferrales bacterium]|jgi:phosphoribosylanthranilate isomerase|nr:phosphoribosylanthranilate isomerase [Candidatus Acidoferrales bacterium]